MEGQRETGIAHGARLIKLSVLYGRQTPSYACWRRGIRPHITMPSSTDGDDMPFYHPQWNEHDKPTVRCPHVEGRRIGDDYCQHVCPHLTRVIDRQYETIIDCGYTVRRSHTPDAGGCRLQTTIATPAESAPAPREQAAEAEAKELQTLFDIQHTRTVAADDAWRNAHPERGSVIPDLGELINWLQARAEAAEAEAKALREALKNMRDVAVCLDVYKRYQPVLDQADAALAATEEAK